MPRFEYYAETAQRVPQTGELEARDARAAREQLVSKGLTVHSLAPAAHEAASRLSEQEVLEITSEIAHLAQAGYPLAPGLRALSRDLPAGRTAIAIERLAHHLEQGVSLDRAVAMSDVRLPPYVCGMLACGIQSNQLGPVLEQFLKYQRLKADLARRMWSTFAYPAILLILLAAWSYFVCEVLVNQVRIILNDFEVELPTITRSALYVSEHMPWLAITLIATIVFVLLGLRFFGQSRWVSGLLACLPLVGPFWRNRGAAEFSDLMAILLRQGIPAPQAFRLTATGLSDGTLSAACHKAAMFASSGLPLADCLARVEAFPLTLTPLVGWGDRLSSPAESLQVAADWFRTRCDLQTDLLNVVVPPLTFLFIAVVLVFGIGTIFLPLVKLIQALT